MVSRVRVPTRDTLCIPAPGMSITSDSTLKNPLLQQPVADATAASSGACDSGDGVRHYDDTLLECKLCGKVVATSVQ